MNTNEMFSAVEIELKKQTARLDAPHTKSFYDMLTYHMGWTGAGAGSTATGKRVRPILVLLSASGCGADWRLALPAAAAVELVHNFSLAHDDIQDNSPKRRGRDAAWVKWGAPMAINVGDALFVLSNQAIMDLKKNFSAEVVVAAAEILHNTCLDLTRGQYLDMSYEGRSDLGVDDYWRMIGGKTSALIAACCHIGATLGDADEEKQQAYRSFGHYLGLAFQVQDDILGIWGDEKTTGKSAASDLIEKKNSLPVLIGLEKKGKFAKRWAQGAIAPDEVGEIARLLANEGGLLGAQDAVKQMTDLALNALRSANPQGEAGEMLLRLTKRLLGRQQ